MSGRVWQKIVSCVAENWSSRMAGTDPRPIPCEQMEELKWSEEVHLDKCVVPHLGRSNIRRTYTINGRTLTALMCRDIWVQVHSSLKVAAQTDTVVKMVKVCLPPSVGALSMRVRKSCCSFTELWFGCIWSIVCSSGPPHYRKDVEALERVQRSLCRCCLN